MDLIDTSNAGSHTVSALEEFLLRQRPPFLILFFNYWTPRTLFVFSTLSRRLYALVKWYEKSAWDIDEYLSAWFLFPRPFRCMLGNSNALISGPPALQFLDRYRNPETSLDIFIRNDQVIPMGDFLSNCGYTFVSGEGASRDFRTIAKRVALTVQSNCYNRSFLSDLGSIVHIFVFAKSSVFASDEATIRSVKLNLTRYDPIRHILNFPSSKLSLVSISIGTL